MTQSIHCVYSKSKSIWCFLMVWAKVDIYSMNFDAFSHGQTKSKLWLCEQLEQHLPDNAIVAILGGWYNLLGFMMLARNHNKISSILNIDIDSSAIDIANKINNGWMIGTDAKINNIVADASNYNYQGFDVVINCSPEHMTGNDWFNNISSGTLVCIQSSDIDINDDIWKVTNANKSLDDLVKKYPLSQTLYKDSIEFVYGDWGYQRFMIIGVK